jgi:hypothetical protein
MPDNLTKQLVTLTTRDDIPRDARDLISATIAASPLQTDVWIYRGVVIILGITVLATVLGGLAIAIFQHADANAKLPDAIVAIGSAAVGALAGLLAPSPVTRG